MIGPDRFQHTPGLRLLIASANTTDQESLLLMHSRTFDRCHIATSIRKREHERAGSFSSPPPPMLLTRNSRARKDTDIQYRSEHGAAASRVCCTDLPISAR